MHRIFPTYVFAIVVLAAGPSQAQTAATGSVTIPAAGRSDGAQGPSAQPRPAASIDYDTIHLEKRLSAHIHSEQIAI